MFKPKTFEERVLHRLKIAQGHLAKVINMTKNKSYCIDIIHQSQAIQHALKEVDNLLLENHLHTCVSNSIKNGNSKKSIKELMEVFQKKAI